MIDVMKFQPEQAASLRHHYYQTYGTTLRGLQIHHQINVDEYLAYVHDLPLRDYIQPRPELRDMLQSLPQRRWILTNADSAHARRVLEVLDISDCFAGIIDIYALDFICKPEPAAYLAALHIAGEESSRNCVILDDVINNLSAARQMGFCTIQVGGNGNPVSPVDYSLQDILALPSTVPELWEPGENGY